MENSMLIFVQKINAYIHNTPLEGYPETVLVSGDRICIVKRQKREKFSLSSVTFISFPLNAKFTQKVQLHKTKMIFCIYTTMEILHIANIMTFYK